MRTCLAVLVLALPLAVAACATTGSSGTTTTSSSVEGERGGPEARAAFQQLQARVAAAGQVALDSDDPAVLGEAFQTRIGLLQEVGGDAHAVLAHGVPMLSVAALVSQADAYLATGEALLASPTPADLGGDEAQTAEYRAAVEAQVLPFEQEALRVYRQAVEVAEVNGIDDVSAARAKEMVAKLTK